MPNVRRAALACILSTAVLCRRHLAPYDEGWKLFVEKFRMPVVAVDYRLLPEHPYPTLYDDCCRVLEWLGGDGARELHIDPKAVFVVGDSAGGNLAQGCATRYKGTHRVRGQLLLYPTLNLFGTTDRYYHPKETDYHRRRDSKSWLWDWCGKWSCSLAPESPF